MINFFYHPGYTKRQKKILTIKLHESVIVMPAATEVKTESDES